VVGGLFSAFLAIRGRLVAGAVACAVVALAIAAARGTGHLGPINFWLQRPDALLIGIIAAVVNTRIPDPLPATWRRVLQVGGWLGVAAIAVVSLASIKWLEPTGFYVPFLPEIPEGLSKAQILDLVRDEVTTNNYWIRWGFTVVGWAMLPVTLAAARLPEWGVGRLLSIRPLVVVGGMSYSLYLIHTIPLLIFVGPIPADNVPVRVVVALATSFLFALPLYHWVEKPSMRRKVRVGTVDPQPEGATP
jgi:peptidoglycan/LPS O-acetylase OafA/YrhL